MIWFLEIALWSAVDHTSKTAARVCAFKSIPPPANTAEDKELEEKPVAEPHIPQF